MRRFRSCEVSHPQSSESNLRHRDERTVDLVAYGRLLFTAQPKAPAFVLAGAFGWAVNNRTSTPRENLAPCNFKSQISNYKLQRLIRSVQQSQNAKPVKRVLHIGLLIPACTSKTTSRQLQRCAKPMQNSVRRNQIASLQILCCQ